MMALGFTLGLVLGAPVAFLAYALALDSARRERAQGAAFTEWPYGGTDWYEAPGVEAVFAALADACSIIGRLNDSYLAQEQRAEKAEAKRDTAVRIFAAKVHAQFPARSEGGWTAQHIHAILDALTPKEGGYTYTDGRCDTCGCAVEGQHHSAECVDALTPKEGGRAPARPSRPTVLSAGSARRRSTGRRSPPATAPTVANARASSASTTSGTARTQPACAAGARGRTASGCRLLSSAGHGARASNRRRRSGAGIGRRRDDRLAALLLMDMRPEGWLAGERP